MNIKESSARFLDAICERDIKTVSAMLQADPTLVECNPNGVLGYASNDPEMTNLLIHSGADVNAIHPRYGTPVARATRKGNSQVIALLLAVGARTDLDETLVCNAVQKNLECVKLLVEAGADIHEEYYASALECQMNALSLAMAHGKKDVADYLRSRGAVTPGEKPGSDVGDARTSNSHRAGFCNRS